MGPPLDPTHLKMTDFRKSELSNPKPNLNQKSFKTPWFYTKIHHLSIVQKNFKFLLTLLDTVNSIFSLQVYMRQQWMAMLAMLAIGFLKGETEENSRYSNSFDWFLDRLLNWWVSVWMEHFGWFESHKTWNRGYQHYKRIHYCFDLHSV